MALIAWGSGSPEIVTATMKREYFLETLLSATRVYMLSPKDLLEGWRTDSWPNEHVRRPHQTPGVSAGDQDYFFEARSQYKHGTLKYKEDA